MSSPLLQALKHYTETHPGSSPFMTAIDGLIILRSDHERHPSHLIFKPALCVVAQGAKWSTFGARRFDYSAGQALIVSVEMPALSRVVRASPEEPYLGLSLEFDLAIMASVLAELDSPPVPEGLRGHGVFVTDFAGPLVDCVVRMVRLLETPKAIAMVAPLIMREICYWLLVGPHGGEVSRLALGTAHSQRIIQAIYVLRDQFRQPVRMDDLAAIAQLSPSAFHRQFKILTSMSPLQYQKQLRLLEARHRLLAGEVNAETAAFEVGYESASQFSREYARMFGAPPGRDMAALRHGAARAPAMPAFGWVLGSAAEAAERQQAKDPPKSRHSI